jgi:hypothetical protein
MPTVVEKGAIFDRFARYYNGTWPNPPVSAAEAQVRRFSMLLQLRGTEGGPIRGAFAAAKKRGADDLITEAPSENSPSKKDEWRHVLHDWLGLTIDGKARDSFFRKIVLPTDESGNYDTGAVMASVTALRGPDLHRGLLVVIRGVIELLEVSLGLVEEGWRPAEVGYLLPSGYVLRLLDDGRLSHRPPADRQVEIVWVCGKLEGFESIVTWEPGHAMLHIVTPPIKTAPYPLKFSDPLNPGQRRTQKETQAGRGVLLVRVDELGPATGLRSQLMHRKDGGVTT